MCGRDRPGRSYVRMGVGVRCRVKGVGYRVKGVGCRVKGVGYRL
jgi:hypothetical protein